MKRIAILLALTSVLLSGCFITDFFSNIASRVKGTSKNVTKQIILQTRKEDRLLTVEIADTREKREAGLMNREKLEEGKGMLFVFQDEAPRAFWMKNTLIPLDVIFLNSKKEVVHIVENMEPCREAQCISYPSRDPAMYALEVRGGFVKAYSVKLGDTMKDSQKML